MRLVDKYGYPIMCESDPPLIEEATHISMALAIIDDATILRIISEYAFNRMKDCECGGCSDKFYDIYKRAKDKAHRSE